MMWGHNVNRAFNSLDYGVLSLYLPPPLHRKQERNHTLIPGKNVKKEIVSL